jgi:hypothetical protein
MACRAFSFAKKADEEPPRKNGVRHPAFGKCEVESALLKPGSREPEAGCMGSVVGIQIEVAGMYTGTLIRDLMAAVERAEMRAEQRRLVDERELERLYRLQGPALESEQALAGAA